MFHLLNHPIKHLLHSIPSTSVTYSITQSNTCCIRSPHSSHQDCKTKNTQKIVSVGFLKTFPSKISLFWMVHKDHIVGAALIHTKLNKGFSLCLTNEIKSRTRCGASCQSTASLITRQTKFARGHIKSKWSSDKTHRAIPLSRSLLNKQLIPSRWPVLDQLPKENSNFHMIFQLPDFLKLNVRDSLKREPAIQPCLFFFCYLSSVQIHSQPIFPNACGCPTTCLRH